MADNAPVPEGEPKTPASPTVPPLKKGFVGKVMVMLSSVAKAPPVKTQGMARVGSSEDNPKEAPLRPSLQVVAPPSIVAKHGSLEGKLPPPGGNSEMRLPPKVIPLSESPGTPSISTPEPSDSETASDPLKPVPPKAPADVQKDKRKSTARLMIPSIKLNQPVPVPKVVEEPPRESIILGPGEKEQEFPTRPRPKIVEKPATVPEPVIESKPVEAAPAPVVPPAPAIVILPPVGPVAEAPKALQPLETISAAEPIPTFTPIPTPAPALVILPPVLPVAEVPAVLHPPVALSAPVAVPEAPTSVRPPPPLPPPKHIEKPAAHELHVVPKMIGHEPVAHVDKLRPPPQLPVEGVRGGDMALPHPVDLHDSSPTILRAPALVPTEAKTGGHLPPVLPPKTEVKAGTDSKVSGPISVPEKIAPAIVTAKAETPSVGDSPSTTARLRIPKTDENKPALRPAVLPNKSLANLKAPEAGTPPPLTESAEKASAVLPAEISAKLPEAGKLHIPRELPPKSSEKPAVAPVEKAALPLTRAERAKKRRTVEMGIFYILLLLVGAGLYFGTLYFTRETRLEGQVIPPAGMPLADEVWIVSDFRQLTSGIAEDVAQERAPLLQEMHEREDHVQRVQADIASREERIHLLQAQIQQAKDEETLVVKQARDEAQKLWDGPGAQMDEDYNAHQHELQEAIASRAKSLNLKYAPDPTYSAPEVWANAYRLALYEVPKGVDSSKEYDWLNKEMKGWRDFVKSQDDQREQLREKAAQIKLEPAAKLTDLNSKIDELQHRIESTQSEEDPLKPELQQAEADLAEIQTTEMGLDAKYYKQLTALPSASITKRLPMDPYGRFSWANVQNDSPFGEGETEHHYWIFSRATRADGREYWALGHFSISKDQTLGLLIDPDTFISTKALLRPDLSPDEQAQ